MSSDQGSAEGDLLVGETATYTATYIITQDDVDDGMEDTLVVGDVQVRYTNNVQDW